MTTVREAARAVVLDDADRILLVKFIEPGTGRIHWATPGGGLAPGETHEDAVRRELREELGLFDVALGPWIWTRDHTFEWASRAVHQRERFFLVRVPEHEPQPAFDLSVEDVHELRWWTLDELEATDAPVAPARLAELVHMLIAEGPPNEPIEVGV